MKKYNVKRIAVVTSIGTAFKIAPLFFKLLMKQLWNHYEDKNNQEDLFLKILFTGSDLEYTIKELRVNKGGR